MPDREVLELLGHFKKKPGENDFEHKLRSQEAKGEICLRAWSLIKDLMENEVPDEQKRERLAACLEPLPHHLRKSVLDGLTDAEKQFVGRLLLLNQFSTDVDDPPSEETPECKKLLQLFEQLRSNDEPKQSKTSPEVTSMLQCVAKIADLWGKQRNPEIQTYDERQQAEQRKKQLNDLLDEFYDGMAEKAFSKQAILFKNVVENWSGWESPLDTIVFPCLASRELRVIEQYLKNKDIESLDGRLQHWIFQDGGSWLNQVFDGREDLKQKVLDLYAENNKPAPERLKLEEVEEEIAL